MLTNPRISQMDLAREQARAERWRRVALVAIILAVGGWLLVGSILMMLAAA